MTQYVKYLSTRPTQTHINVSKKTTFKRGKGEKQLIDNQKYNIHIYMNQYIKYLSTRPKQTHIKCF